MILPGTSRFLSLPSCCKIVGKCAHAAFRIASHVIHRVVQIHHHLRSQLHVLKAGGQRKLLASHKPFPGRSVPEGDFLTLALVLPCANMADSLRRELTIFVGVLGANYIDDFQDSLAACT